MTCKHGVYGRETADAYASRTDEELRQVLHAFNERSWRNYYRGNHRNQAYRHRFFKLARERGVTV